MPSVNLALFNLWFDSLGTGVKNTFNKTLKCFRKKLSVSNFLPTRMFMPFLFLLIQISCQLAFSVLSPCFTSRMIFILILHLQKSFICSRRHHLFMHITRDHPRKMMYIKKINLEKLRQAVSIFGAKLWNEISGRMREMS